MDLTYYGHSTFQLDTQGTSLLFDPFFADNPHTDVTADAFDPDVVLLTHAHFDHYADVEGVLAGSDPLVIANFEITQRVSEDYDHDAIQPLNEGGSVDFDWGTVEAVHARHSSSFPDGSYGGVPVGFVLALDDGVVYNTGDTAPFAEMAWIGDQWNVDLMLAPVGNVFTMGISGAVHAAEMVGPSRVAPLHYDTFPPLEIDLDVFREEVAEAGYEPAVFEVGATTTL
jgi:L-ascorbate metabolism protein UlaG (beta-lactamase superfamily)